MKNQKTVSYEGKRKLVVGLIVCLIVSLISVGALAPHFSSPKAWNEQINTIS